MSDKEQLMDAAEDSFENVKLYADQQLKLFQLELAEKSSLVISSLVAISLQLVVAFFILGFLSLALGLLLGELLGSYSLAFIIITGVYTLLLIILFIFRNSMIIKPVQDLVISKIFNP